LLNEYCKTTGQNRKYAIWKIRKGKYIPDPTQGRTTKRKRNKHYNSYLVVALIKCAKIFSWPCGQRLKPLLQTEVNRLRRLKELDCSDETANKLKQISQRIISSTDIACSWWEGQAVVGKGQKAVFQGLLEQRKRFPNGI
jgi:hypothetical protein